VVERLLSSVPNDVKDLWRQTRESIKKLPEEFPIPKQDAEREFEKLTWLVTKQEMEYVWKRLAKDKIRPSDLLDWVHESNRRSRFPKRQNLAPKEQRVWEERVRQTLKEAANEIEGSYFNFLVLPHKNKSVRPKQIQYGHYFLSDLLKRLSLYTEEDLAEGLGHEPQARLASPGGDGGEVGRRDRFIIHITKILVREVKSPRRKFVANLTKTLFPDSKAEIDEKLVSRVAPIS